MNCHWLNYKCCTTQERRKALDAERSARLAEMQLKRRRREEEIEHGKLERDKVCISISLGNLCVFKQFIEDTAL